MEKKWWHDKVAYQIYPKSFLDTNGDGIGDLRGIISKLDYLKKLGIDIIWLSPIYKSPFVDQGYDIADYYAIAEEFGTMEEFDELLAEAKKRDMHIIMDLVINHCSDKHEWFQKALADPDGAFADYFYFRKGKNGNPPSNYRSYFGGSCWEPVPGTDLYYLHMFAKEQPDLNWENPVVRKKLYEMVNWWLEKGLAGFRIDAIINIKKDLTFSDLDPDGPDGLANCWRMVENVDGVGSFLEDLKKHTFQKYDAFTVGEVFNMKEGELADFIGENGHFSTIFDFSAHILSEGEHGWYDADGRVFIYYTVEEISADLCCGRDKAMKLLAELDKVKGAGLIERVRQGQGKPTKLYVKRFTTREIPPKKEEPPAPIPEVEICNVQKSEIPTSRGLKTRLQEVEISDSSYIDNNYPELSYPDPSIYPAKPQKSGWMERWDLKERVRTQIGYDALCTQYVAEDVDALTELIAEIQCSAAPSIRIGKEQIPIEIIKERFRQLTQMHVEYVLDCLKNTTTQINNVKAYLLTALYNAPMTMGFFYSAQVRHDFGRK